MSKILNKNEIIQAQMQQCQAYILYWQTKILSGAYKNDNVLVGGYSGQLLDEQELLGRALGFISNHCQRIDELIDNMDRHYEGEQA